MIKKVTLSIAFSFFGLAAFAQTIVSTTAENRNVILEEFTGVNCGFCPEGHVIAQQLKEDNPVDVFLVNIHSGGFAAPGAGQPDFRTQWGQAIDNQSGLAGYPAGTINRQNFPGQEQGGSGSTALGRGEWVSAAGDILADGSYLNMAVEASMDAPTNTMTIHVEAFYTGNSPEASNFLNVAILQNNTLGPQSGGNMGNNYNHQHRLIDMVNGQWGEEITTTSQGTFIDRTYSYSPPGDLNANPVVLSELELVAYMTETTQFVISGSGAEVTLNPLTSSNDANLLSVAQIADTCGNVITPSVTVSNTGTDNITSLDFTYSVNGGTTQNYTWTGTLGSLETTIVELDEITFALQANNTVEVSVASDDFNDNNDSSTTFDAAVETAGTITLRVTTDDWAEELTWNFTDSSGTVLESGSYSQSSDDQTTFNYSFNFSDDCITFNAFDEYGDGLTVGGNGGIEVKDANDVIIYAFNGNYGAGFSVQFDSDGVLGLGDNGVAAITVFPNPASTTLNITNAENASIEVYNILGQVMVTKTTISNTEALDVSQLATGTYLVKISNGDFTTTKKFVVLR
jgi:hypothetical protein